MLRPSCAMNGLDLWKPCSHCPITSLNCSYSNCRNIKAANTRTYTAQPRHEKDWQVNYSDHPITMQCSAGKPWRSCRCHLTRSIHPKHCCRPRTSLVATAFPNGSARVWPHEWYWHRPGPPIPNVPVQLSTRGMWRNKSCPWRPTVHQTRLWSIEVCTQDHSWESNKSSFLLFPNVQ